MLQQYNRTAPRAYQGRANRIRQPQIKENRKTPVPKDVIVMLDGTHCPLKGFQDLRSNAHKKLKGDFTGIAQRIRLAVADQGDAWNEIINWIDQHRPKYGAASHQNDTLLATAITYAASRFRRPVSEVINDVCKNGMQSVLFPAGSN